MGMLQRIATFLLKLVLSASQCDLLVKLLDKRFAYYDNSPQDVNRGSSCECSSTRWGGSPTIGKPSLVLQSDAGLRRRVLSPPSSTRPMASASNCYLP
jgi:hypothetical protein